MMIILFISAVLEYKKIEVYFIYDLVFYIHCNPSYCTYIACRIPCCPHPLLSICPPGTPMSQSTEKKTWWGDHHEWIFDNNYDAWVCSSTGDWYDADTGLYHISSDERISTRIRTHTHPRD